MRKLATARDPERRVPSRSVGAQSPKPAAAVFGAPTLKISLTIRNQQRTLAVNLRFLRAVGRQLFKELPQVHRAELGVYLVAAPEMTRLNEIFLQHGGSTDVITFDYAERETRNSEPGTNLHGEIFICVDEAVNQARRFRTTWPAEVVRYLIHGVLHLLGHDDHRPAARRTMKRAENQLLRSLAADFDFCQLAQPSVRRPARKS